MPASATVAGPRGLRIGALPSASTPTLAAADFTLVELTVWTNVLDTNARIAAEGYIANAYSLNSLLPPSSPYAPNASPAPFQAVPAVPQPPSFYPGLQVGDGLSVVW
jgi:hypothetical protein